MLSKANVVQHLQISEPQDGGTLDSREQTCILCLFALHAEQAFQTLHASVSPREMVAETQVWIW